MLILTTRNAKEDEFSSISLFDTETGLRYRLIWQDTQAWISAVTLEIESAHSHLREDEYPMTYYDDEALVFWAAITAGRNNDLVKRSLVRANAAILKVESLREKESREQAGREQQKNDRSSSPVFWDDEVPF